MDRVGFLSKIGTASKHILAASEINHYRVVGKLDCLEESVSVHSSSHFSNCLMPWRCEQSERVVAIDWVVPRVSVKINPTPSNSRRILADEPSKGRVVVPGPV